MTDEQFLDDTRQLMQILVSFFQEPVDLPTASPASPASETMDQLSAQPPIPEPGPADIGIGDVPKRKAARTGANSASKKRGGTSPTLPTVAQLKAKLARVLPRGAAVVLDYLVPETPTPLLLAILDTLQEHRVATALPHVARLLMTFPKRRAHARKVQEKALAYIVLLNQEDGEQFLRQLTASDDPNLRLYGQQGLDQFQELGPEHELVMLLERPGRRLDADLLRKQRVPFLARQIADRAEGRQMLLTLQQSAPNLAMAVNEHLSTRNGWVQDPATSLRLALNGLQPLSAARIQEFVTLGREGIAAALAETAPKAAGPLLECLLAQADYRSLGLALLEEYAHLAATVRPALLQLLRDGEPAEQIRAAQLLQLVPNLVLPSHHIDFLFDPALAQRYPTWVQLVSVHWPDEIAARFADLCAPLRQPILEDWLAHGLADPIAKAVRQMAPNWESPGMTHDDAWMLLTLASRIPQSTGAYETVTAWAKKAVSMLLEVCAPAALPRVVELAATAGVAKVALSPRFLEGLDVERARMVMVAAVNRHPVTGQVPAVLRLMQRSREQESRLIYELAHQWLRTLCTGQREHTAALLEAGSDDPYVIELVLEAFPQLTALADMLAWAPRAGAGFVGRLLEIPQHKQRALDILECAPGLVPSLHDALLPLLGSSDKMVQVRTASLLSSYAATPVPDRHVEWLGLEDLVVACPQWAQAVVRDQAALVVGRLVGLPEYARRLALSTWLHDGLADPVAQGINALVVSGLPGTSAPELLESLFHLASESHTPPEDIVQLVLPALVVLLVAADPPGVARLLETVAARSLVDRILVPECLEQVAEPVAQMLLEAGAARLGEQERRMLLIRLLRQAAAVSARQTATLAERVLVQVCTESPAILTAALRDLAGTRIGDRLLDSFATLFHQISQHADWLERELEGARAREQRELAKAVGPELEDLESLLQEPCSTQTGPQYQQRVRNQFAGLRRALTSAGLRPVESDYAAVPYDWNRHRLVPPGPTPSGPVRVRSLGIQLDGEDQPVQKALVVRTCEEGNSGQ